MAAGDLTTLDSVKTWLGRTDSNSDAMLSSLITRASRQILSHLERGTILPHTTDEVRDGTGGTTLVLRQWPVTSVESVMIDGRTVPPCQSGSGDGHGWTLEPWDGVPPGRPQALALHGLQFGVAAPGARTSQRVLVSYTAGYQVTNEAQMVSGGTITALAPYGAFAAAITVAYADGVPLVAVTGSPAQGEYALSAPGVFVFNAADEGAPILLAYAFVPAELADACIELVAERFKYSERIGERSHSLGGNETVSFDTTRLTPLVAGMLQPFRRTIPV